MVELPGVIFTLSIEVLAGDTFIQLLKANSREMTARPSFHEFIVAKELHCLARPIHLGVLIPIS